MRVILWFSGYPPRELTAGRWTASPDIRIIFTHCGAVPDQVRQRLRHSRCLPGIDPLALPRPLGAQLDGRQGLLPPASARSTPGGGPLSGPALARDSASVSPCAGLTPREAETWSRPPRGPATWGSGAKPAHRPGDSEAAPRKRVPQVSGVPRSWAPTVFVPRRSAPSPRSNHPARCGGRNAGVAGHCFDHPAARTASGQARSTASTCHSSGTPLSAWRPWSSKTMPEPTTRSRTVPVTRPRPRRPWRSPAPRCDGQPADVVAAHLHLAGVQACAQLQASARAASTMAAAQRTAWVGAAKRAASPSPVALHQAPSWRSSSRRTFTSNSSSTPRHWLSPRRRPGPSSPRCR